MTDRMRDVQRRQRPIRVLHLRDSPWVDGPGRTILETASRMDPSRVDYRVGVFVADSAAQHPLLEAAKERRLNVYPIADRRGISTELVDSIVELLREMEIDILHTSEFRANILALMCRRKYPMKIVSTAHGWITNDAKSWVYAIVDRMALRLFDRVILVSRAMRKRVPRWLVPASRVRIIHNALMVESYGQSLLDRPRLAPDPHKAVRLLNVGRLSPEKGQLLLVEACAQLAGEFPGLQLAFAGVGPLEGALRARAAALGFGDRIDFLGFVQDMPALYAQYDLVVQSSFTEGLPNVMLEVAFLGIPVVATDVGGTREVIEHGVSGWLIEPRSKAALIAGIRRYLQQPQEFIDWASAGRVHIETHFTFPARTSAQASVYEEIVQEAS